MNGTANNNVYFTSNRDESIGGDTNGIAEETPLAGDWGGINFNDGSTGNMNNAEIHFAGRDQNTGLCSAIYYGAIHISGGNVALNKITFNEPFWYPIKANIQDQPTLNNISFLSNSPKGLILYGSTINQNVTWDQTELVHVLANEFTVAAGQKLTIAPGMIIKFAVYSSNKMDIFVEGTLEAEGTAANRIFFTSLYDDTIGGDTNGDGNGTAPTAGNWSSIEFRQGSTGSIQHAEIRYGGSSSNRGAIHVASATPAITNSVLRNNSVAISSTGDGARPTVGNTDFFYNSQFAAVAVGAGVILAANNWWGDRLGPNIAGSNPAGQAIQGEITYSNWRNAPKNFTNSNKSVKASVFINNTTALYTSGSEAVIEVSDCTHLQGNSFYGAIANYNSQIKATNIWWGNEDGPNTGTAGSGDKISGNVIYDPWALDEQCVTNNPSIVYIPLLFR